MKFAKLMAIGLAAVCVLGAVGCGGSNAKDNAQKIVVVSREEGSGTRGAFIELFGIEQKNKEGKKVDLTTDAAAVTNSTAVMMTTVAGNKAAIGYISLGSLNDTVKGVKIDGAEPSTANVKSGQYKISRPFNIVTKGALKPAALDFVAFILSKEGQAIVNKAGYIGDDNKSSFIPQKVQGKVVVAGSSSVTPVMEKLKEGYKKINPEVVIEVQQSDSTTGVKAAVSGICDIGMSSRALKESELKSGAKATLIAKDGIAVILNKENAAVGLSKDQVKDIFTSKTKTWQELGNK